MLPHRHSLPLIFAVSLILPTTLPPRAQADEAPVFEKDVLPIFTKYCFNCHGNSSPQLGLELRTARQVMKGSQNGAIVVKGVPDESLLWKKISKREMPPALFNLTMTDEEIEIVRQWILAGALSNASGELPEDVQAQFTRFEDEILPLLQQRCVDCHGETAPEAGLDLRSLAALMRGSNKGPVIIEGFSDKSVLIRKLTSKSMPPPDAGEPLSPKEIEAITSWIDKGRFADFIDIDSDDGYVTTPPDAISEQDRTFWAFQKPVAVAPPNVAAADRVRTPIDRFVLAKLEAAGLAYSPDADRQQLLRRAYFDLTGLPPTPEQAKRFLADERPDAYERLIDELLASPRYGERWGRYWLDVAGYVDTKDKDFDIMTAHLLDGYWRYRDYVINSTNEDVPWDRFLIEQIAGDELVDWRNAKKFTPEIVQLLTATGFLRNVLDATDEDISDLPFDRYEAMFKLMERVSTSTMAMTMACARCHNHKFDPIPQTDYYRFLSLFTAAYNPSDWLPPTKRHLFDVSKAEHEEFNRQRDEATAKRDELLKQVGDLRAPFRQRVLDDRLAQIPEAIRADTQAAVATDDKSRTEIQKYLADKFTALLTVSDADADAAMSETERAQLTDLQKQIAGIDQRIDSLNPNQVQALWDVGPAPTIRLLQRGDVDFAGPKVSPGFVAVLSTPGEFDATPSPNAVGETSGLRLAFAEWLTSPDHPLTARVIVNRMWQHHFGTGIVATPGNFGATGAAPTHPELLDWLAVDFMEHGWSAKRLHRMMMLSNVYRQSSARRADAPGDVVDPQNKLLWRMNLRRLDAEAIRDAIIAVSGNGDFTMGGPPVAIQASPSGLQAVPGDGSEAASRRSIYLVARRSNPVTFLRVFDYPVIDVNCTQRSASATPLQSLTLINSEFLAGSAKLFADHIERRTGADATPAEKIETAFWLAYSRAPSQAEVESSLGFLAQVEHLYSTEDSSAAKRSAFENFVHMLQCANEFLYVD